MTAPLVAIVNPAAGRGRAGRDWLRLAAALRARGIAYDAFATRAAGEATELAARHGREAATLLAVGGDGTLHEVVNGLIGGGGCAALAVAPFGTGNDWARELGVPRAPDALAALIARRRTRRVDAGLIEYHDGGRRALRHFINVAGVGLDAFVVEHLARRGPRALAYLRAAVAGLVRFRAPRLRVAADRLAVDGRMLVAFALLGRSCGGGLEFAPRARPDDGLLDVVTIESMSLPAALARLPRLYTGSILDDPRVHFEQCKAARIDAEPAARVEADGQLLGTTPVSVRLVPRAAEFLVP
jgi:diacylglycerol kinase (ATP)